jgi:type 1 fimbriae regulatory protein FimB/type 1 fimbriae regulatory protein FimE
MRAGMRRAGPNNVKFLAGIEVAKGNRHGHRNATMILLAFDMGCGQPNLSPWNGAPTAVLHVRRVKKGTPATHPLRGDEMRALRKLRREGPASSFVFTSERGAPFSTAGFAKMMERTRSQSPARVPVVLSGGLF